MAKQHGLLKLSGSIDDVEFVHKKKGYYARRKAKKGAESINTELKKLRLGSCLTNHTVGFKSRFNKLK